MLQQSAATSRPTQNNNDVTAIALRQQLLNQNNSILSLSGEEVNDVKGKRPQIVNTILDSNDVQINNTNNNYYNAPVVIHKIYPEIDKIDQKFKERTDIPLLTKSYPFECFFYRGAVKWSSKRWKIAIALLVLMVSILIITLIAWSLTTKMTFQGSHDGNLFSMNLKLIFKLNSAGMRIVTREEWEAQPARGQTDPLTDVPPPYVIISHTETVLCYTQDQCTMIIQRIQIEHMKPWYDIAYNFLVGGDGLIYEGRGWGIEGAHTLRYNRKSIGVSLIGTFKTEPPTKQQLLATQKLIEYGVQHGHILPDYKLFGHRQLHDSDSPGAALFNIIISWKNWTPVVPITLR